MAYTKGTQTTAATTDVDEDLVFVALHVGAGSDLSGYFSPTQARALAAALLRAADEAEGK